MKLLIVTQKVNRHDPILGFFCRWIEEFAQHCEKLIVVGQLVRDSDFAENVDILSLKKEKGLPRCLQVLRFWKLQWSLRKEYDSVLVHMTPIWIVLGAPLWFLLRKKMYLWYEIKRGSWRLALALMCVRKVFSATVQGLPRPHRKQVVTGHGIDTKIFTPNAAMREKGWILAVGRVTRSKRYDVVLRAFAQLPDSYCLKIAGGPLTSQDEQELKNLQILVRELNLEDRVLIAWIPPERLPRLFQWADLCLHACIGGLDKVVLESMACGCPIVTTSKLAEEVLPPVCLATEDAMAHHARELLALSDEDRNALARELRSRVEQYHSLPRLIDQMVGEM